MMEHPMLLELELLLYDEIFVILVEDLFLRKREKGDEE
jgi:hypothetical protein